MLFDEDNHPVDASSLTAKQRARLHLETLLQAGQPDSYQRECRVFSLCGVVVTAGQDHEAPLLYRLVEAFVEHHGRGVMKRLILDRGFLTGLRSDVAGKSGESMFLIPARHNMEIFQDVLGLARSRRANL